MKIESIEYPKRMMKRSELMEMGFPGEFLMRAFREKGQSFAAKMNPLKANSHIIFDTQEFEKWRKKQVQLQGMAASGGGAR